MFVPFVIDLEASGLGKGSYPIEVGFVTPEAQTFCSLIKPAQQWRHWDNEAESLHKISREILSEHGKDIAYVTQWLNDKLHAQTVYSDGWANDMCWLGLLFDEAGQSQCFRIESILTLLDEVEREQWTEVHHAVINATPQMRHRASTDAMMIQKTYRILKSASLSGDCPIARAKVS